MSFNSDDIDRDHDASSDEEGGGRRGGVIEGRYDRIVMTEDWTFFRLIPGPYENREWKDPGKPTVSRPGYFRLWRHYMPKLRPPFETCRRAGNEFLDLALCPPCQIEEREPSPAYAFTVLGLAYYHVVPTPSQRNPNKTFDRMHRCERTKQNKNCRWCAGSYKHVLGYRGHFTLNGQDFERLFDKVHLQMRTHCRCGGEISVTQGACPRCHSVLLDVNKSGLSDSEFHRQLVNKLACPACHVLVRLQQIRKCSKCAKPEPLSMYDCNLRARLVPIPGKDYKQTEFDIVGVGPLAPQYGDIQPLDLPVIYAPSPLGVLKRKIPSLRARMQENPADPNAVSRMGLRPPIDDDVQTDDDGPSGAPPPPFDDGMPPVPDDLKTRTPPPAASMEEALKSTTPVVKAAKAHPRTQGTELPPPLEGDLGSSDEGDGDFGPSDKGAGEPWEQ